MTPNAPAPELVSTETPTHVVTLQPTEPDKLAARDAGVQKFLTDVLEGIARVLDVREGTVYLAVSGNSAEVRKRIWNELNLTIDALGSSYVPPASKPMDAFEVTDDVDPRKLEKRKSDRRGYWGDAPTKEEMERDPNWWRREKRSQ
jgi:hypothetical protein